MNLLGQLGDRLLEKFVPKATAQADSSYWMHCWCYGQTRYMKLCHIVGGTHGCTVGCQARERC
ncbi:hypothetical protein [Nonomuraea typhae]|uniref:Uncharacterized protein n=1 Tax=Nonomuraea typhae TaxID=2603600 RepID=A0ABW7ZCB1_9ACTN